MKKKTKTIALFMISTVNLKNLKYHKISKKLR